MSSSSVANPEMQNPDVVIGAQQFPNPKGIVPQADDEIENSAPTYAGTPLTGGARMNVDNASGATFDTSNPPRAQLLPAQARHLDIKQGPLLPMPKERPIDVDTGYRETPDSLTTTGYTTQPAPIPNHSRVVAYPNGAHVAFPDSLTAQEFSAAAKRSWDFLKNEAVGAGQAIVGLPSAIADSVTVAPTPEEQKSLGVPANPTLAQKAALALYRNLSEPIANAAQFYGTLVKHNQSLIDAIPTDVLAQGLGAGAGAAVLGKVLAPSEETTGVTAKPAVKPTSLKPIAAPLAGEVKPVAPLSPESRAAAAYLAKNRATLPTDAVEEVAGQADRPKGEINIGGKTSGPSIPEATATPGEIRAYIKHAYPDAADAVLKDEKPEVATSEDVNKTAEKAAQGIQARVEYSKQAGDLIDTHRVDVSSDNGGPRGHLTAIEDKSNPRTWTIDTAQISPEGTGAGLRAYTELAKQAKQQGAELQSGSVVSDAAQRVWDKLKGQGFDVHEVEGLGGKTYRIPAPEKKPPQFDLTDDWKHAAQDAEMKAAPPKTNAATAGRSVGAASINDLETKPDVPAFYSKAEQVINEKVPNNASGDAIKSLLQNNGVKAEEMKWAGLDDFLKDKPKVSKADLQQFIQENQIQLRDVDLGKTQRFTTKPNVEETARAGGEPMVDVIDPKNGQVRFTGVPKDAQDYMSELGQGLSSAEEFELNDLHSTTHAVDQAKINTRNVLTAFGVDSPQYANAVARQRELVDAYTGGKDYETVNDANNARIIELENKAKQGATDLPTKYDKWTLPGERENYQEKLLTLPTRTTPERLAVINEYNDAAKARDNYVLNGQLVPGDVEIRFQDAQQAMHKEAPGSNPNYTSPHWGNEPNVVAHVRFSDRPAVDGKKTLFMEEAQSDWHSEGRHEGYRAPVDLKELSRQLDNANDAYQTKSKNLAANPNDAQAKADAHAAFQETQRLERAYNAATAQRGVPDAPFRQSWHELAMKRMLRHAAENGYDRLAWTTGDQQADLYNLAKHIGKIEYDPEQNELRAYDPKGTKVLEENVDPTEKELSPYIGQEHAKNLVSQIENYEPGPNEESLWDSYSQDYGIKTKEDGETGEEQYWVTTSYGEDEGPFHSENAAQDYIHDAVRDSVQSAMEDDKSELPSINNLNEHKGGEFHRLLYDTMIPSFLKKYAKKWGAQVGTTEIKGMGVPLKVSKEQMFLQTIWAAHSRSRAQTKRSTRLTSLRP